MFSEVVDFSQAKPFGKHVKPSTVATVKEALEFRSVKDTQRVLQSKDVDLSENKVSCDFLRTFHFFRLEILAGK